MNKLAAVLVAVCTVLAGCAGPALRGYHDDPQLGIIVETENESEMRRRFGDYIDMVGRAWVATVRDWVLGDRVELLKYEWMIKGALLQQTYRCDVLRHCGNEEYKSLIQWDNSSGNLFMLRDKNSSGTYNTLPAMTVLSSGEVQQALGYSFRYDRSANTVTQRTPTGSVVYRGYSLEDGERALAQAADDLRGVRRESQQNTLAILNAVIGGLDAAARDQAAMNQRHSQIQSGVAQAVANAPRTSTSGTTSSTTVASQQSSSITQPRQIVPTNERATTNRTSDERAPTVMASSLQTPVQDRSEKEGRRLIPTPEAILVCTRPDGRGNFTCQTPVDTLRGGPNNGLAAWNTPESLAAWARNSCPESRRLRSSTHLVWGCGFGATNNVNTMDRSAGVDVSDRRTYYCSERQLSCRRTEP